MKQFLTRNPGTQVIDSLRKDNDKGRPWTLMEKIFLGLTPQQYVSQAMGNPLNWIFAVIFLIGFPVLIGRYIFGLSWAVGDPYDNAWGLFLAFGLFGMVPLSSSGFQLGSAVEVFGRHDFEPIERLGILNGILGYFFAVVFLMVDLGQPWRLPYPMVVSWGPEAVLFLVAWHVATYLSVQAAETSTAFFEWMGWPAGKAFIKKMALGLAVAGIILSTLHQGALGALSTYAPGKVHPLWYSASFQWLYFFVSSLPGGLCMVIVVSTIALKTMGWRCDDIYKNSLSKLQIALAKGASMGLITYLTIRLIGIAHDNKWAYLATGWGAWWMVEIGFGVILSLVLLTAGIRNNSVTLVRMGAWTTIIGVVLNRLNVYMFTFNWQQGHVHIPPIREIIITVTVYSLYIVTYRAILYRWPILFKWKTRYSDYAVLEPKPVAIAEAEAASSK